MKKILIAIGLCAFLGARQNSPTANQPEAETVTAQTPDGEPARLWNGYTKISPLDIPENAIKLISKDWMLITAGNEAAYNTMTASWGALGEIWGKPASIIAVRGSRYTHEFTEANEFYTLCFFEEAHRDKLQLLGTKSGRDTDKIKESGLTPVATPEGSTAFEEAWLILECKKKCIPLPSGRKTSTTRRYIRPPMVEVPIRPSIPSTSGRS